MHTTIFSIDQQLLDVLWYARPCVIDVLHQIAGVADICLVQCTHIPAPVAKFCSRTGQWRSQEFDLVGIRFN